mmetsp:Transcript_31562/g.66082  ORF Transcript_31562/g.66082 Transcript_31562/m.66082 type:complete len:370 (-) Transcript_31562:144-1253(-)
MFNPLKTLGSVSSSSIISNTLLLAFPSVKLATQTSATKSLEISPAFNVSSPLILSSPVGGLAFNPPGLTMVQSIPDALRYLSATIFSSSTPPKALVTTNPGDFSCPHSRPLVRMEETMTTFLMPADLAASMSLQVPTLSTSWADLFILRGLPGTKPTAMTRDWAPERADARDSVVSETSIFLNSTPAASKLGTFCTIAPLTTVLLSPKLFSAFSTLRTPAITERLGWPARRSRMRRPVCPVAPATTTVGDAAGAEGAAPSTTSSALAIRGRREETASVSSDVARRVRRLTMASSLDSIAWSAELRVVVMEGGRKALVDWPARRRRAVAIFIMVVVVYVDAIYIILRFRCTYVEVGDKRDVGFWILLSGK